MMKMMTIKKKKNYQYYYHYSYLLLIVQRKSQPLFIALVNFTNKNEKDVILITVIKIIFGPLVV